jgi:hypothetical protein
MVVAVRLPKTLRWLYHHFEFVEYLRQLLIAGDRAVLFSSFSARLFLKLATAMSLSMMTQMGSL